MSRAQARIKKQFEKNPVIECNKIQKRFCGSLFQQFTDTKDPRHQSYIEYSNRVMLGTVYYKNIAGIISMQSMTEEFNDQSVVDNICHFLGEETKEFLPHGVTINEYFAKLSPSHLQEIQQTCVYDLIRRKTFNDAKFQGRWLVIVDGSQLYSGRRKLNGRCLERHYNKDTPEEIVNYHTDVLEAKIVLGEKLIVSLCSEFIENNGEDAKRQEGMSAEEIKQDCETKAFKRLAEKVKKRYPRLPITLLADSLYASEPVMDICAGNDWEYIIRYKAGSIPSISEEYEAIPEKESACGAEYINEIDYNGRAVNVIKYWEERVVKKEKVRTEYQWLTSIKITQKNAGKIVSAGRRRWKIENEGFNRQKNWQGDITHACSFDEQAMKNHYLMIQIADMIKQLYEWFYLKANDIKKKQKNISSDLLRSFSGQLTVEDISQSDMHSISTN